MNKRLSILFLLFSICSLAVFSQGVKVTASIDSSTIEIGDHVKMDVKAAYTPKSTLVWPELKDSWSEHISIINKSKIDTIKLEDSIALKRTYTLTSYDSGSFYIPSLTFKYKNAGDTNFREAFSDSILLDVKSIAVDTTKAIRDIRGPISVPYDWRELIPYIIGTLLLIALLWFAYYYFKNRKKGVKIIDFSKPVLPAHEIALLALEELKNKKLWQNNKTKEYYSELTEIIRIYIEERFVIAAMEMTSDEIITAFRSVDITDNLRAKLRQLFVLADLVKFAKATPLPNEHDLSFYNAQAFVRETIPGSVPENTESTANFATGISREMNNKEDNKHV